MLATYKLSIILNRTLLIDFMKYSQEFDEEELPLRTSKTQYDYYLEYENILPENMLIHKTLIALGNKGYEIAIESRVILLISTSQLFWTISKLKMQ